MHLGEHSTVENTPMSTVLIVDDAEANRRLTGMVLRNAGYTIHVARDGIEALEIITQERPDLVLLDLQMPRMNGWELSQYLKTDAELRSIPLIALTGHGNLSDQAEFRSANWAGSISKPFDIFDLVETVGQLIGVQPYALNLATTS
jgi:two-component system cell cycle response regulator DivK